MTDTRDSRGPAARRARALAREVTAEQRARAKLGIFPWPEGWPPPSKWDVPGRGVRQRRHRGLTRRSRKEETK